MKWTFMRFQMAGKEVDMSSRKKRPGKKGTGPEKQKVIDPNRVKADVTLKEIVGISEVVLDAALEMGKEDKEAQIQSILVETNRLIQLAKTIAVTEKLEFSFLGATLRYPENSGLSEKKLKPTMVIGEGWATSSFCSDGGDREFYESDFESWASE